MQAGLIPALRHGALPGSEGWFYVNMIPAAHPLNGLETALLSVAVKPVERPVAIGCAPIRAGWSRLPTKFWRAQTVIWCW